MGDLAEDALIPEIVTPEKQELLDDLRQSIHEAMTGQTIPASKL